jgi:type IV secretion system protein TrbC
LISFFAHFLGHCFGLIRVGKLFTHLRSGECVLGQKRFIAQRSMRLHSKIGARQGELQNDELSPQMHAGPWLRSPLATLSAALFFATPAFAQQGASPWENAVGVLQTAFTSTIARGLSLVAIVVAGLTFAFGEGGSKRVLAGVLFSVGMAIAAVNFLTWLFLGN